MLKISANSDTMPIINNVDIDNSNRIYFDNDDDFYAFSVNPTLVTKEFVDANGNVGYYCDFDFTPQYYDAVNAGKKFIIKDENSNIYKHQAVSFRTISKPVSNLGYYYEIKKRNK